MSHDTIIYLVPLVTGFAWCGNKKLDGQKTALPDGILSSNPTETESTSNPDTDFAAKTTAPDANFGVNNQEFLQLPVLKMSPSELGKLLSGENTSRYKAEILKAEKESRAIPRQKTSPKVNVTVSEEPTVTMQKVVKTDYVFAPDHAIKGIDLNWVFITPNPRRPAELIEEPLTDVSAQLVQDSIKEQSEGIKELLLCLGK